MNNLCYVDDYRHSVSDVVSKLSRSCKRNTRADPVDQVILEATPAQFKIYPCAEIWIMYHAAGT
jgi:hypothetical protein